jgi:hypothetical protein
MRFISDDEAIVRFDVAMKNAQTFQINQCRQQAGQYVKNGLDRDHAHVGCGAVCVSFAEIGQQSLTAVVLDEVEGGVSGVILAGRAVWRHVLVQQMRDVGVVELLEEPRFTHDKFEGAFVDVYALDDATALGRARRAAASRAFRCRVVFDAKGSAERSLVNTGSQVITGRGLFYERRSPTLPIRVKSFIDGESIGGMKRGRYLRGA